jgi:hypothetical protein
MPSRAVPQSRWLQLAEDEIDAAFLRADARRNVLAIARAVGWSADWHTSRSRPTLARLMEVSGLSLRTVQRWTRWLEHRGLLAVLEPGATAEFRPGILHRDDPNRAREWLLTAPAVYGSDTPSGSESSGKASPRTREALRSGKVKTRMARAPRGLSGVPPPVPFAAWRNPGNRAEGLAAAAVVLSRAPVLRDLSPRHVRHIARPFFAAGYSPGDILHCVDHEPDGRSHGYVTGVRHPAGWLRHRLSLWLSPAGVPVPSPGQLRAAERERVLAEQSARRRERERAAERPVDVAAHAARARELLSAAAQRGTVAM